LGIITLEDVLEELIGEEILDEFDLKGPKALPAPSYVPAEAQRAVDAARARAAAKNNNLNVPGRDKSDPLGLGGPGTNATNLRIAQGLRAIRMKAGSSGASNAASGAGTPVAGGKRAIAPSLVFGSPNTAGRGDVKPASSVVGDLVLVPPVRSPSAPPVISASHPVSTTLPTIELPPPPFTAIVDGDASKGIPIARGGSKGAKKRVFKSPIAGEGATPGLEKRGDPTTQTAKVATKSDTKSQTKLDAPAGEDKGGDHAAKGKPRHPNLGDEDAFK